MHYYQFNIGDYAKRTRHLTNFEDLAYRRMIDLYYTNESPFPDDIKQIARLITLRENVEEITNVLNDFFFLENGFWTHKRADEEIASYHAKADAARANGKKGGRPKKPNPNPDQTHEQPNPNPAITQSVNLANPEETGSKANQEPVTSNQEPQTTNQLKDISPDGSGNKVTECPHDQIKELYNSILNDLVSVVILSDQRKAKLRTTWKADERFQKIEFWENLFNYIKTSDFLMGRSTDWSAGFDFIINKNNLIKIIEGNYDNKEGQSK